MGNSDSIAKNLAPHTSRREARRSLSRKMQEEIMKEYDKSHTGALSRSEVKEMATKILGRCAPELGGLEFEEIELIMMCGGKTVQPELAAEELPEALSIICAIKEENENLLRLFRKYDVDKSGDLPASQLKPLLQEVNDGIEPPDEDIAYILRQCEPRGATDPIKSDQLKAALACWYCLADDNSSERQRADFEQAKRLKEEEKKTAAVRKKKPEEEKKPKQVEELKQEQKDCSKELAHGSSNRSLDEQLAKHMRSQLDEAQEAKRKAAEEAKADEEQRMRAEEEEARRAAEEDQQKKAKEEHQRKATEEPQRKAKEEQQRIAEDKQQEQAIPKSSPPAPGFFSSLLDTISCQPCVSGKKGEDVADAEAPATPACDDKPL